IAWHSAAHSSRAAPRCLPAAATVSSSDPKWDQAAHMHVRCLIPSRDCLANPYYAFGLPVARVPRSGQEQPGRLVFGQLFGPPFGGVLAPLWSPPTIRDSSFSSSVRRVSFDRVSFFFMNPPLETVLPTRVTRSGQVQLLPGPLVFGQVFGPPFGGTWPPLCAPPTIWDRSFSSSVRRVSFDRVTFFSFKNPPPPFRDAGEPSRAGSMFGQPSERRR